MLTGGAANSWGPRSIMAGAASFLTKGSEREKLITLVEDGITASRLIYPSRMKIPVF